MCCNGPTHKRAPVLFCWILEHKLDCSALVSLRRNERSVAKVRGGGDAFTSRQRKLLLRKLQGKLQWKLRCKLLCQLPPILFPCRSLAGEKFCRQSKGERREKTCNLIASLALLFRRELHGAHETVSGCRIQNSDFRLQTSDFRPTLWAKENKSTKTLSLRRAMLGRPALHLHTGCP